MLPKFAKEEEQQDSIKITELGSVGGVGWSGGFRVHKMNEVC